MCSVSELPGVRLRGLGSARGPFRRCLCWCCCCSCNGSCLAVRNGEDNGPTKKEPGPSDVLLCDGEPPPSLEEIQSWGTSFDKLMRSTAGRKVFRDFLRCEYSEENILFWLACEELKKESNPDAVEEKARFIYEDYISILSPKEVSLDSRVREVVNRNMVEPTPHTFDEAQLQIYTLMHRDSYPRFVNSSLYKTLAQVASTSCAARSGSQEEREKEGAGEATTPESCKQLLCSGNKETGTAKDTAVPHSSCVKEYTSQKADNDTDNAMSKKDINKTESEVIKGSTSDNNQTSEKNVEKKTIPLMDLKVSASSENKENVIETKECAPNKQSGSLPHNNNKQ